MALEHKGYSARIEYDDNLEFFHGEVVGINDIVTFQAGNLAELNQVFRDSVDDYLDFCATAD